MSNRTAPSITLAACGDLMLYGRYQDLATAGRADWVLAPLAALAADADLLVANLENPLTTSGAAHPDKLCLRGDPAWAGALAAAGVSVVNLANNHMLDFGPAALAETRALLSAAGIAATGAGANLSEALTPVILARNGLTIGLLGACDLSTKPGPIATATTPGIAPLDPALLLAAIDALRPQVDQVVLMLHWGLEYSPLPTPEQVAFAHAAIDRGVGVILGHHSHCIQGLEHYNDGLIAYSLANVTDDAVDVHTAQRHYLAPLTDTDRESFLLRLRLDGAGVTALDPVALWLGDDGRPAAADGERAAKIIGLLEERSARLRDIDDLNAWWEASVIERRVAGPLLSWWQDGNLWDKLRRFRPGQIVSAWLLLHTYVKVRFSRSQSRWLLYSERNDTRPMPAVRPPRRPDGDVGP